MVVFAIGQSHVSDRLPRAHAINTSSEKKRDVI